MPAPKAPEGVVAPLATGGGQGVAPMVPTPPSPAAALPGLPAPQASAEPRVRVRADALRHDRAGQLTTFRGNVRVDYRDTGIDAEELIVDAQAATVRTGTRFTLTQPDAKAPGRTQVVTGVGLTYHYQREEAELHEANVSIPAETNGQTVHVRAKTLRSFGANRFEAEDATFSTCAELLDEKVPHYHVEAKALQYEAGEKIVAWDNKVYLNGRYAFWLPVWVIPLKNERNDLNIGRSEVEGFFLRNVQPYELPALNSGYWLNGGKVFLNLFEKKGLGLGLEHTARWGYDATTYAYFYGLPSPDRANFLNPQGGHTPEEEEQILARGRSLFNLRGLPFDDRSFGVEHRHRLFRDFEFGGRLDDINLYDPLTHNFRANQRSIKLDHTGRVDPWGGLNYGLNFTDTEQRGNASGPTATSLQGSVSDRLSGNLSFRAVNTDVRLNTDFQRSGTRSRTVSASPDANGAYTVTENMGESRTNVTTNLNAATTWSPELRSTFQMPYRVSFTEPAPASPAPSGSPATPTPKPSPWSQQIEPQLDVNYTLRGVGSFALQAQKLFDLTQLPDNAASTTPEQADQAVRAQGRFDRLPEITYTSESLFPEYQPFSMRMSVGRYFEYATFKREAGQESAPLDRYFPGLFINRINPELTLAAKPWDLPFRTKVDFGGSGYRQFFYSTMDAQYAVDQRIRLTTDWARGVSTTFNYTNNLTPDVEEARRKANELRAQTSPDNPLAAEMERYVNNSPFQMDRLSLTKQTRLQGSLDARFDPWLSWAFRGGYDYQNRRYDNLSSELSWRNQLFGFPFGMSLNGQYDLKDTLDGGLEFERKDLGGAISWLKGLPTYGLAGTWLPVTGTFTLRSTPQLYGGNFGSDRITPGWQLDTSLGYDFDKGKPTNLQNNLYLTLGDRWENHVVLKLGGYYAVGQGTGQSEGYKLASFAISKDLHDFVLTFQYDQLSSFTSLSLTMLAFPSQPLAFSSNTFDRRVGAGGNAFPGLSGF